MCAKAGYETEAAATRALVKIRVFSAKPRVPCRAYLCPRCSRWHLTSRPA